MESPVSDRLYLSIGEVARIVDVAPHVLRYWEKEFPQLRAVKRSGNRRVYRRGDVDALLEIRRLLYDRRFTVTGARDYLRARERRDPQDMLRFVRHELIRLHQELTGNSVTPAP
ncbi:MAG: MerR family transcriptional regulator [Magnetococcus sp. WYHC-3]